MTHFYDLYELLERDDLYFTICINTDPFLDFNYIGITIVKCKEGYLSLPIEDYDIHNGFEQYDLKNAELIKKDVVEKYYNKFKKQEVTFRNFLLE